MGRQARGGLVVGVLLAALPGLACYRYVPTSVETVAPGSDVRAMVSVDAQRALRDQLGRALDELDGTVVARDGDRLLISVGLTDPIATRPTEVLYQRVEIPARDVISLSLKRLHVAKTSGLIGVLLGAAVFVGVQLLEGGEPGVTVPPREKGGERVQGVLRLAIPGGK